MKLILIYFFLTIGIESSSSNKCLYNEGAFCTQISDESCRFTKRIFKLINRNLKTLYNYPYNIGPVIINNEYFHVHKEVNIWTPITRSAHAFAHQLNTDNRWFTNILSPWDEESKADYIAGFILNKMGASLQESQKSLIYTFSSPTSCGFNNQSTPFIPSLLKVYKNKRRLNFLTAGYQRAFYRF